MPGVHFWLTLHLKILLDIVSSHSLHSVQWRLSFRAYTTLDGPIACITADVDTFVRTTNQKQCADAGVGG